MKATRSCEYHIQQFPECETRICGKTGVKRATGPGFDFVYCKMHYDAAKKYLEELMYDVEDYE